MKETPESPRRDIALQAASRLAALRKEQGLTLKALAGKTGLSEAYLSRLENFKAPLSLDNLDLLAEALQVPIEMFFKPSSPSQPLILCRAGSGKHARFRGPGGFLACLPAEEKGRKLMEPLIIEVDSAKDEIPKKSHSGEEFDYVISGRCEFVFGNQRHILEEGDSVYFDAEVPHAVRPLPKTACRLLAIVSSDEYAFHGNLKSLLNDR